MAADDIRKFFYCFSEKIRLDSSCESSAVQKIHMKDQVVFSFKAKSEKQGSSAAIFIWHFKG